MAKTVQSAFLEFRTNAVDLDPDETTRARRSRDHLINQLKALPGKVSGFPPLTHVCLHFGSFARKTKIRPLDDIDLMLGLRGERLEVVRATLFGSSFRLRAAALDAPLIPFADAQGFINSTRILNKIRDSLGSLHHYQKAEIRKSIQVVTLNLTSYAWVFDIVPHVARLTPGGAVDYYLIPDGHGNWIKTNPRIDAENMTRGNGRHNGQLLPVLRLLKYWNRRTHKPRLPSYYFETLVLNGFNLAPPITTERAALFDFFRAGQHTVLAPCLDPQRLGGPLDRALDRETKRKVVAAMAEAAASAGRALKLELQGHPRDALAYWGKIFGPSFPTYG